MAKDFFNATHLSDADNKYICWSRMQTEAGQPLGEIFKRKELERQCGDGVFFWGVGNPPAKITTTLAKMRHPVDAIFSVMKSKPKLEDVKPGRTVLWQSYIDKNGRKREVPPYVLVTSRGDTNKGAKRHHYALICYSTRPLEVERGRPFDPTAYLNTGDAGKPIGASQVTALLRRVHEESSKSAYEINLQVKMHDSYWVRLEDPVTVDADSISRITKAINRFQWLDMIKDIKETSQLYSDNLQSGHPTQLELLSQAS